MRHIHLAFALAATIAAEALPAESIPLACVTICSPIVDLSSQCNRLFSSSAGSSPDAARTSTTSESVLTVSSTGPLPTELAVDTWKRQDSDEEAQGEVGCFCGNESFDVKGLVGACLGCVEGFDDDSNVSVIEKACGFSFNTSEKRYDPSMDAVVGALKVRTALSGAGKLGVGRWALAMLGTLTVAVLI